MCACTLGNAGRLVCQNPVPHEPHKNCVYISSSLGDAHDASDSAARAGDER